MAKFISQRCTVLSRSRSQATSAHGHPSLQRAAIPRGASSLPDNFWMGPCKVEAKELLEARSKERRLMQELNDRLARYVENLRFLQATTKQQQAEIETLKKSKREDFSQITAAYDVELTEARKVLNETCKAKGDAEARLVGLQEEAEHLKTLVDTLQKQARDYVSKIDTLNSQNGEYEGELGSLRGRVGNLEDEIAKEREFVQRQADEIRKLRVDVDTETAAHIEADNRAQSFEEESEFLRALLDKMPKESQQVIKIKGLDPSEFWKGEVASAIRDLTAEFDQRIDVIRSDSEMKLQTMKRSLQSSLARDSTATHDLEQEVKRLRDHAQEKTTLLADLEARLPAMEAERNELARQLREMEHDLDQERLKHSEDVARLQAEMEGCLEELKQITDAKLSLELEIAFYRVLLDGEEDRMGLKQIVDDQTQQLNLSQRSGLINIKRSFRGPIAIQEAAHDGAFVTVENIASGAEAATQNMRGWSIKRQLRNGESVTYHFPDFQLRPGSSVKIYARGAARKAGQGDLVADFFTWGSGAGTTQMFDENEEEKADLRAELRWN